MRRCIIIVLWFLSCFFSAKAQVAVISDVILGDRMSGISMSIADASDGAPVSFASVYLIPVKDTVITNFTLSDTDGKAEFKDIPFGGYVLHIEMMGYKPYAKEEWFRKSKVDLGKIVLEQDKEFLTAAVVQDVGNPIVFKKDTIEFNASAFLINSNGVLRDLLKRMPGMEITDDGKVRFNGEEITRITVGGRTFFFGDQSMALNNLPAAVVDRIQIIEKDNNDDDGAGGKGRKEMNVALKKEYEEGWFGNVGLNAGSTVATDKKDVLRSDRGLLYSGNALAAAYDKQDQVTAIGNLQNFNFSGSYAIRLNEDGSFPEEVFGLSSLSQIGVNATSSRIKDTESAAMVTYKATDTDMGSTTHRTTWRDDGDLDSDTESSSNSKGQVFNSRLQFKKEKGKVWFHLNPSFRHSSNSSSSASSSEVNRIGEFLNSASSLNSSSSTSNDAAFNGDVSFRAMGGKKGRVFRLNMGTSYSKTDGESQENSSTVRKSSTTFKALNYVTDRESKNFSASFRYSEPIGQKWVLVATGGLSYQAANNVRDAFDSNGKNDLYSTLTKKTAVTQDYGFTARYRSGNWGDLNFGAEVNGVLDEIVSKNKGVTETTGVGQWNWFMSPVLEYSHSKGKYYMNCRLSGYTTQPYYNSLLPSLDISNPTRISLGNVNLTPTGTTRGYLSVRRNDKEKFSTQSIYISGTAQFNPLATALWYDSDGILYSIPVNSTRPTISTIVDLNSHFPLNTKRTLFITIYGHASYDVNTSYQSLLSLPALNTESFDYFTFMSDFWGSEKGEKFYGGDSGFKESKTQTLEYSCRASISWKPTHLTLDFATNLRRFLSWYSLKPEQHGNTLIVDNVLSATYTTDNEWIFDSQLSYASYWGYSPGYGDPICYWAAGISKNIDAFTLSVKARDILNQIHHRDHVVTANYVEDVHRLAIGRYITIGVKWNFGKMNVIQHNKATDAAWEMAW